MDNRLEVSAAGIELLDESRTQRYNNEYDHGSFDELDSVQTEEEDGYKALWVPHEHYESYETDMEVATIKTPSSIHHFVKENDTMRLREKDEVIKVGKTKVVGKDRRGLESAFAVAVRSSKPGFCFSLPTIKLVIRRWNHSTNTWAYLQMNFEIRKIRGDLIIESKVGVNDVCIQPFLQENDYVGVDDNDRLSVLGNKETFHRHVLLGTVSSSRDFVYLVAFERGGHFISSHSQFNRRTALKRYPPFAESDVPVENRLFRVHELDERLRIYQSAVRPAYFLATRDGTLVMQKYSLKGEQAIPDNIVFTTTYE